MTAMTAYYNEFDLYAAQWLRNLIDAGHIAPGIVDERSIEDVRPIDLHGFTQCHFFAGIGVWSLALRRAGWADERRVWTASCPCQPFSAAGQGAGLTDERHLWPHLYHLIDQCQPAIVLGEQVASKDAEPWLDLVQTDLEAVGYAFGAVAFPSAGVGAPHIRDRTYWVANSARGGRREERAHPGGCAIGSSAQGQPAGRVPGGAVVRLAHATGAGWRQAGRNTEGDREAGARWEGDRHCDGGAHDILARMDQPTPAGPTNGLWRDADWLLCRDGKWRPVEPGTFPLAHGAPARVGRLRAYGNSLCAPAAEVWITTVMDCIPA